MVRSEGLPSRQCRDYVRMFSEYCSGSDLYSPLGIEYGGGGGRSGYLSFQLCGLRLLCFAVCEAEEYLCMHRSEKVSMKKRIVFEVCSVGIPASIQNLLNVTGMTILNNFTAVYGGRVAAMGIAYKL